MSDLIRREDALKAVDMWESDWNSTDSAIRALPAVQPDDDLVGHMTKLIAAGLDRIEQLAAELDGLTQTSALLCDDCGWAMKFPDFGCVYCGFHRLEKERDALTTERERLALAICGGEDAPGHANAQTVETLEHVAKQNQQSHGATINSLLAAEAERDRLREALHAIQTYEQGYAPQLRAIARAALNGETP